MAKRKLDLDFIVTPRKKSRLVQARESCCPYHEPGTDVQAENFCGAWVNDGSNDRRGRECYKPLCREHAQIRLQLWLCPEHTPKDN